MPAARGPGHAACRVSGWEPDILDGPPGGGAEGIIMADRPSSDGSQIMDGEGTPRSRLAVPPAGTATRLDFPGRPPLAGARPAGTGSGGAADAAGPGPVSHLDGFVFDHDELGPSEHYFFALDDQDNQAGFAHVLEKAAAGGSAAHVLIRKLYVRPGDRGQGIGSRLLEEVAAHFAGRELRLKPYPGEDEERDTDQLREFYADRGFTDYIPGDHEGWEAWEYMTTQDRAGPDQPQPGDAGAPEPAPAAAAPGSAPARPRPAPGGRPGRGGRPPAARPPRA